MVIGMSTTTVAQARKAETSVRSVAYLIANSPRFRLPLRVRPEIFYSDDGNPGCAIDATSHMQAYVELRIRYGHTCEVTIEDRGTGTTVSKFCDQSEAVKYAVDELLYRGEHLAMEAR